MFSRQTEFMTKMKTETEEGKLCKVQLEAKQGIFQSFTVSFFSRIHVKANCFLSEKCESKGIFN